MLGQVILGLVNGSFYAVLSLGLSVIFGMLNIVNFSHGAFFMIGAYATWLALGELGIGYWWCLLLVPCAVGMLGTLVEYGLLRRLYGLDSTYGLLFTFGLALALEGTFSDAFGVSGQAYPVPAALRGALDLGFMRLPVYRGWVLAASVSACLLTWLAVERTKLGSYLRAATENPSLVRAFGVRVPRMVTLTYGFGTALAAFAGVLAAPVMQINPLMGANVIVVVFAVVVIGGMGSIMGSVVTGLALGMVEGLAKVLYAPASSTVVFMAMVAVLLVRPNGLFGAATAAAR